MPEFETKFWLTFKADDKQAAERVVAAIEQVLDEATPHWDTEGTELCMAREGDIESV